MKKWIAFLLALVMCLSLCACSGGNKEGSESEASAASEAKEDASIPQEDQIAIESITLTPRDQDYTEMVVKIRNLTDEKQYYIGMDFQALDENGDIICERPGVSIENVQPGQAGNTMKFGFNCGYDQIASICTYEYYFGEKAEGSSSYAVSENIEFQNPLVFVMSEEIQDGNQTSYVWTQK